MRFILYFLYPLVLCHILYFNEQNSLKKIKINVFRAWHGSLH